MLGNVVIVGDGGTCAWGWGRSAFCISLHPAIRGCILVIVATCSQDGRILSKERSIHNYPLMLVYSWRMNVPVYLWSSYTLSGGMC